MPQKKKKKPRNLLKGSSKMARLQGVSKPAAALRKTAKASPLASALCADAVSVAPVVEVPDTVSSASAGPTEASIDLHLSPLPSVEKATILMSDEHNTTSAATGDLPPLEIAKDSSPIHSEDSQEKNLSANTEETQPEETGPLGKPVGAKSYASLLKQSAVLEELGTPSEHISGAPFVFIPDENIAAAKEEFRGFIFARFHGEWPSMGRIIGVANAIWAKTGPRIFVHNVGPGEFLLRVTTVKTRELLLARAFWKIAGFPMFVAPWSPDFTPEEAPLTNAVVPVEMRDVPYLLFNKESLSRLATAVGLQTKYKTKSYKIDWEKRWDITNGIARGLLYLHQDSRYRILHRDLKPSNILLDKDMVPKISDFGMAKLFARDETEATSTTNMVGTFGYMPPEYAIDRICSVKSDVFSFGVLLLEIIAGKRNNEFLYYNEESLLFYIWKLWLEGKGLDIVDPVIVDSSSTFRPSEVLRCIHIGLLCVQETKDNRPLMSSVMLMLTSDKTEMNQPERPGSFVIRNRFVIGSSSSNQPNKETCTPFDIADWTPVSAG
ncbi:hypothetical protein DY000_02015026 [Brassica cretica]|uniref:Protein kinase domain-containing protein n=1 Tax=Brassica cretica TaxID=69181 RepID=A0ABQ7D349_BRACR|nr:hypothetical protein DY000_02015026 [Brassica cretica]